MSERTREDLAEEVSFLRDHLRAMDEKYSKVVRECDSAILERDRLRKELVIIIDSLRHETPS